MEHRKQGTASNTTGWYVVSADRVTVVRVHSGMTIGENESGELSYDRAHAQIKLDIDSDSLLVVRALGNIQLAAEGNGQTDCLTFKRSVEVSLAHNTLMFNIEFNSFRPSKRALQLRLVYPPVDMRVAEAPAEAIEAENPAVKASNGVMPPSQSAGVAPAPLPKSTRKILAGLAVAIISLVFAVPVLFQKTSAPPSDSTDEVLRKVSPEISEPSTSAEGRLSDDRSNSRLTAVPTAKMPVEKLGPTETLNPVETLKPFDSPNKRGDIATLKDDIYLSTYESQLAVTVGPEESLNVKDDTTLITLPQEAPKREVEVDQASVQDAAATGDNLFEELPSAPVESVKTQQAVIERSILDVQMVRALAQERALERDLLAADLALAEGRLMLPEASSALTLYSRVLSQDPDSPGALRGIASVREQLINRAFAQLAVGDWSVVAVTLDAAEQAGASGDLVVDLRSEASYQLRLARARSGQFDELYPSQQLEAIEQQAPRLPRWARGGHGPVEVEFTVTMGGDVRDVQILGNPPPRLADAIGRAVGTWRFEPVLENGRPLPVRTQVTIDVGS